MSSTVAIETPELPTLPQMSGRSSRVRAVERDRVERGRQAVGRLPARHVVEAAVGAFRDPLAREHPRRLLAAAPVRVDAGGVRIGARQVVLQKEPQQIAPVRVLRQRQFRHSQVAEGRHVVVAGDLAPADRVAVALRPRGLHALGPASQEFGRLGADFPETLLVAPAQARDALVGRRLEGGRHVGLKRRRKFRIVQLGQRPVAAVRLRRRRGSALHVTLRPPSGLSDLGQIPIAIVGDQDRGARRPLVQGDLGSPLCPVQVEAFPQLPAHVPEHPVDARILELAGDRRVDGHVLVGGVEGQAVAPPLLADVAECVLGAAPIELVEHDHVGEIEHVDLLELTGRAVVRGHHVDREVGQIDDLAVALTDAGRLHKDQGEPGRLEQGDGVPQHFTGRAVLPAGRRGTHEHPVAAQAVHADAVAEQGAAGAAPRRVHREDGDPHPGGG